MDYCALQHLKDSSNVFNTLFYYHKIDSYLEQHKILEFIGELLIQVGVDRPENENLIEYMCQKLMEISERYVKNSVVIRFEFQNAIQEGSKMIKQLSAQHQIPLIECVKGKKMDEKKFHCRRLIICNFTDNDSNDKKLRIEASLECLPKPQDVPLSSSDSRLNLHRINYIYGSIRNTSMTPRRMIKGNWNCRAMIVGRKGAGRKTQAVLMAKEFKLRIIDLDYLMDEYQQRPSPSEKHNLGFWGFVQETLLKPKCLRNGFVIVSNVISKATLEILMERFICRPNRIIFLHTSANECRRRLGAAHDNNILNYQMNLYDLHKREFVEYFKSHSDEGHKIFHIVGSKSIHEIKTLIWANLVSC
jgi:shikimate kinase